MIRKMVRYKVQPGKLDLVKEAIAAFVEAIAARELETRYEAFETEEDRVFVHVMAFADEAGEAFHQSAPHTLAFVEVLYPNCEEAPVFTNLRLLHATEAA